MSRERAAQLLEIFDDFDGEYKEAEVNEALSLREDLEPLLDRLLEEVAEQPENFSEFGRFAHHYAVPLLIHFRAPATHLPIIRAFSLPGEALDAVWGEVVTDSLPALLCRTAGGDYRAVKALTLNQEVEPFVRAMALEALKLGVAQGDLARDEALAFYASLMDDGFPAADEFLWTALVFELLDLYPGELIGKIRDLYRGGVVTDEFVPLGKIEKIVEDGLEQALAKLPDRLAQRSPDDVHAYIAHLGCFRDPEWDYGDYSFAGEVSPPKSQEKKKQNARKKRKQANAAKRKNRK